jgi:hypothetical protein
VLNPGFRDRAECDATARCIARGLRDGEGGDFRRMTRGGDGGGVGRSSGEVEVDVRAAEGAGFKPRDGRQDGAESSAMHQW